MAPARRSALAVLARVRKNEAFSGAVLAAELGRARLSSPDAALATRLAYGTLAAEGVLDAALAHHLKGSVEPRIRDVLRLASFELLFGRAPAYAVVDQAVELTRHIRPQAAGLANAVIRKIAEDAVTFPWGDPEHDLDALARLTGHPRWIVDAAVASLGSAAAREMLECGLEPAPTYVRLDPFACDRAVSLKSLDTAGPLPSPPDPDCYRLEHPAAAFRGASAHEGWFAMDAAAQMAPCAVNPVPGARILDVGAGRGNKTVCLQAIAVRAGGPAVVVAVDVHEGKAAGLRARLDRSGVPGVAVAACDAHDLTACAAGDGFDAALVDAPCTGLGTLRRYPEKRWRLDPAGADRLHGLQAALLLSAARVVGVRGRVVYSTCSVAHQENGAVISEFLASAEGRGFAAESLEPLVPGEWGRFLDERGCFASWPTSGGPDGHYVAVLRRVS